MLSKKTMGIFLAVLMFLSAGRTALPAYANDLDENRKGSVAIMMQKPGTAEVINGGEFTIYRVAEVRKDDADLSYHLTPEFSESRVDLRSLHDAGMADALEVFVAEHKIAGQAKASPYNGKVLFEQLEIGLYLIVQNEASEGYFPAKSFLVSVPVRSEDDTEWIYDVDATPKTELKPEESGEVIEISVKKVWEDDGKNRPESITAGLYEGDILKEKVILDAKNQWKHTWNGLDSSKQWKVQEINVPKRYVVSYQKSDMLITIKNTASLIQTGQLNWPVPLMAFAGLVLILVGFVLLQSKRKSK